MRAEMDSQNFTRYKHPSARFSASKHGKPCPLITQQSFWIQYDFFYLLVQHWPPEVWPMLAACLSWQPSPGGLHAAALCSEFCFGIMVDDQLQDQSRFCNVAGRRVTFQEPSKHRYPTCKRRSCDLLESLRCRAASALREEPAGFSFFTVRIGKEKLIKPPPEVRMHQKGQPKLLAQQTHRQQPLLRPRPNNYWQPVVWTRQSWLFLLKQTNCPGKAHHPQTLFHQLFKRVSCKLLEAQKLQTLGSIFGSILLEFITLHASQTLLSWTRIL